MDRKRVRVLGLSVAALAGLGVALALNQVREDTRSEPAAPDRRPNVLLIVTDDQRPETLRVMPGVRRWFKSGGVKFSRAYVTTPLCCPSRASIFTGRYAHNHGIRHNHFMRDFDDASTIQHHLRGAGYRTAIVGQHFHGWPLSRAPADFDRWTISNDAYVSPRVGVDGDVRRIKGYSTRFFARQAVRVLTAFEREDDSAPWFVYVAPLAPHAPFVPEKRYADAPVPRWKPGPAVEEQDVSDKPAFVSTFRGGPEFPEALRELQPFAADRRTRALQLRTLMSVDDLVDAILAELRVSGELEDTLAIFTSDNGYQWGEHRALGKRLPYRESIAVPLLVRYPGVLPGGEVDDRIVANIDLAPTIADAAGLDLVGEVSFDGMSLLGNRERKHLFIEEFGSARTGRHPWRGIVSRDFRFTTYLPLARSGRSVFEFYRLRRDPFELQNVLGDGDPVNDLSEAGLSRLNTLVERYATCAGEQCP